MRELDPLTFKQLGILNITTNEMLPVQTGVGFQEASRLGLYPFAEQYGRQDAATEKMFQIMMPVYDTPGGKVTCELETVEFLTFCLAGLYRLKFQSGGMLNLYKLRFRSVGGVPKFDEVRDHHAKVVCYAPVRIIPRSVSAPVVAVRPAQLPNPVRVAEPAVAVHRKVVVETKKSVETTLVKRR